MGALVAACFAAMVKAAQFAAQAIAAFGLAAGALVFALAGAVLAALALACRGLALYAGAIVRVGCAALAIVGIAIAFGPVWSSFGGDVAALLPAAAIVLSPIAFVMLARIGWGGLALAGVATIGMGYLFPALSPVARMLFVMLPIGAAFYQSMQRKGSYHVRQSEGSVQE